MDISKDKKKSQKIQNKMVPHAKCELVVVFMFTPASVSYQKVNKTESYLHVIERLKRVNFIYLVLHRGKMLGNNK